VMELNWTGISRAAGSSFPSIWDAFKAVPIKKSFLYASFNEESLTAAPFSLTPSGLEGKAGLGFSKNEAAVIVITRIVPNKNFIPE
jgi:hypothetical protein